MMMRMFLEVVRVERGMRLKNTVLKRDIDLAKAVDYGKAGERVMVMSEIERSPMNAGQAGGENKKEPQRRIGKKLSC